MREAHHDFRLGPARIEAEHDPSRDVLRIDRDREDVDAVELVSDGVNLSGEPGRYDEDGRLGRPDFCRERFCARIGLDELVVRQTSYFSRASEIAGDVFGRRLARRVARIERDEDLDAPTGSRHEMAIVVRSLDDERREGRRRRRASLCPRVARKREERRGGEAERR